VRASAKSTGRSPAAGASALALLALAAGCGGSGSKGDGGGTVITFDAEAPADGGDGGDATACSAVIESHPQEGFDHIADCHSTPTYGTNPPSSGNHFNTWADFHTYTQPIPWGHLVHSLEHGAIVIVYNCPDGCPDEVAHAQAFIDNLPVDPLCTEPDPRRVILAPDPMLDVRWAASAWTWTLRATCFHDEAFAAFARDHYGMGREPLCNELGLQPSQLCP
jgi:hypothetical protein